MARRRLTVRDIAEILEHWRAGRSIRGISHSLGLARPTVRKYVYAAEARGLHPGDPAPPQGWKAFLKEVAPKPPAPLGQSEVFNLIHPFHEGIKNSLVTTRPASVWQRLRDEEKLPVSLATFYRYLHCYLPDIFFQPPHVRPGGDQDGTARVAHLSHPGFRFLWRGAKEDSPG